MRLLKRGESGPPCGVPSSTGRTKPSSITPAVRIGRAHDRIANGCVGLPNGRFASISRDRKLRIWQEDAPNVFETPHANSIKCVNASPDGRWIATGSYAGSVAVFDTRAQRWCHTARPTAAGISCIVPTGRGAEFLASSYDGCTYPVCAG